MATRMFVAPSLVCINSCDHPSPTTTLGSCSTIDVDDVLFPRLSSKTPLPQPKKQLTLNHHYHHKTHLAWPIFQQSPRCLASASPIPLSRSHKQQKPYKKRQQQNTQTGPANPTREAKSQQLDQASSSRLKSLCNKNDKTPPAMYRVPRGGRAVIKPN